MKKIPIVLLALILLVSTAGCMEETGLPTTVPVQTTVTQPQSSETVQQTEPYAMPDFPLLAFSAPVQTRQHYADDGTLLFTYAYQDVSLILEDPQIADAIVIDLLNYTDYENSSAKSVLEDAQAAYDAQADWVPFAYSTFFTPERFDQGILSLYGTHAVYSGSPRSVTTSISITYDLVSGHQLALKDILSDNYSADALSQLITNSLSALSEQGLLFSDYAYVVSEMFSTNQPVDSWYFSDNGLCFYFAPYEIAPYSSGTITAEIPYTSLVGTLKEEYFPAEIPSFSGTHQVLSFQDANLDQFERFAELVLDEDEQQFILYTDSCIQNLRIELGSWSNEGSFHAETTVFTAPTICAGDGIVIHAADDTISSLNITYTTNNETVTVDISPEAARD